MKLVQTMVKRYGERLDATILLTHKKGKSILVSGDNLHELELLLEQIGDKKINVYTHGRLFLAHTFPYYRKYKNLIGHYGSNNPQNDFVNFKGAILTTKNHNQKIDTIYRGLIYSSDILAPKGVTRVLNNDFTPLINSALKLEGFNENEEKRSVTLKYNKNEIDEAIKIGKDIVVFTGCDLVKMYLDNKTVIDLDYPLEVDLLIYLVEQAKRKNIKISVFFPRCYPQTLNSVFLLKSQKVDDIYFLECDKHLVHPRIIESLEKDFGVKFLNKE